MLIHATEKEMQFIKAELLCHQESGGLLQVIPDFPEVGHVWDNNNDDDRLELLNFEATTLLHVAAKYGNVGAAQYLLDNGYDVDTPNPSNRTPLTIAFHYVQKEIVKVLVKADASICLCVKSRRKSSKRAATCTIQEDFALPMINTSQAAFFRGNQAIAKQFLKHELSLPVAACLGDASLVTHMLDNGRAVDERDSGRTALHMAVFFGYLDIVNLLLDRGIDVNIRDDNGITALLCYDYVSEETDEKLEVLKTMLNRGALLDTGTTVTPLHCLCLRGKRRTVRVILEHNDSLLAAGKNGLAYLEYLMCNKNEGIADELKNLDMNVLDQIKAVAIATFEGCAKILELLLERGAIEKLRAIKVSVLSYLSQLSSTNAACAARFSKCAEVLLRYGEDVQCLPCRGKTIFDNIICYGTFYLGKIFLAHLALREELGEPIKQIIVAKIDSDVRFKKYFGKCKRWLEKAKRTQIGSSTTLFEFFTTEKKKLFTYARNPTLVAQLERIRYNQRRSNMHYCNLLRRRFTVVLKYVELKKQVALVIPESCALRCNDYLIEMIANFVGV